MGSGASIAWFASEWTRQGPDENPAEVHELNGSSVLPGGCARDDRSGLLDPSAVFNAAVDAEIIGRSPARKAALPRVRPPEKAHLTAAELLRLAGEVPSCYRALVLVGGVLGLRWEEAIGLRVRHIDFLRRSGTVAQTVEEVAGHLTVVAQAKSEAGLRSMTAPAFLTEELVRHLAEHRPATAGGDLVFVGPRGGMLRRRFGERTLPPAAARAGLPASLTFHGLRHAAITALAEEEVHPRTMPQRTGHASARLTLERCTRVTDASDRGAAEALERRFRKAISGGTGTGVARGVRKQALGRGISPGQTALRLGRALPLQGRCRGFKFLSAHPPGRRDPKGDGRDVVVEASATVAHDRCPQCGHDLAG
ncbi:MAG: hypothetical protein QOF30_3479 [Acidimicrobiaceae bacterium]|nr:hypothetical protein [Acidimicrobiaceae bacterium]